MNNYTIEKEFYKMKTSEFIYRLRNVERPAELITAVWRTRSDYEDEVINEGNECAELDEVILIEGKEAAIWSDWETWETFITFLA